jgi:hypothetical protein
MSKQRRRRSFNRKVEYHGVDTEIAFIDEVK